MAAEDYAILTGISWYPNPGFTQLQGPSNDLELVRQWLGTKGGVPADRIQTIMSPAPPPTEFKASKAQPTKADFEDAFRDLMDARLAMGKDRLQGRLYLYFSGHGFCNRSQEKVSEAALYCANASKDWFEHIFGTGFARTAVSRAIFKEIILIMDCCRDSELTKAPTPAHIRDVPDDDLAAHVKSLYIYATPKGGKAHEKPIAERGNKVHGLLTHALIKLLDEAADTGNLLSATVLKDRLLQGWPAICGEDDLPRPEVHLPSGEDIQFETGGRGSPFQFRWAAPAAAGSALTLTSAAAGKFTDIATISLNADVQDVVKDPAQVISFERDVQKLTLYMAPGLYRYLLSNPAKQNLFSVDGGDGYVDL